jgi:hypothetical protein
MGLAPAITPDQASVTASLLYMEGEATTLVAEPGTVFFWTLEVSFQPL